MQCPVCRAEVTQGPACRRCRADLSLLFTLEEQRRRALAVARRQLAAGETELALRHATQALKLRPDAEARRLVASIHCVRRDFTQALEQYRASRSSV